MREDLYMSEMVRVMRSMISFGVVTEISKEKDKVRVRLEDGLETSFLPVLRKKAHSEKENWPLEIGEQVLCLFAGGKMNRGAVIGSVFSGKSRPNNKFHHIDYGDGTEFSYEKESKKVSLKVASGGSLEVVIKDGTLTIKPEKELKYDSLNIVFEAENKINLKAKEVIVDSPKVILGGSSAIGKIVTTESICAFTGSPHPDGSSKCFAVK